MKKELISEKQAISMIVLFIIGESMAMQTAPAAGRDLWLAIILAMGMAMVISLIYSKLLSLFPGKDLYDIIEYAFGRFFGKIINVLYVWFVFHTGSWVLRDFVEFPITLSVPETPKSIFAVFIIILCVWVVKSGIEVLGRWSEFFIIFNVILPLIALFLLIPQMELCNIQPFFYEGFKPFLKGTFNAFSFPFSETFVFTFILCNLRDEASPYKVYFKGLFIGGILLAIVSLGELLVIGIDIYLFNFFPGHAVVSKINVGELIQRMEMIPIISIMTSIFVKIAVYLYATCIGFSKLFNIKDYRFIVTIVGLLMCNVAFFGSDSITELFELAGKIWLYYSFPFHVVIPLIILAIVLIKRKRKVRQNKNAQ